MGTKESLRSDFSNSNVSFPVASESAYVLSQCDSDLERRSGCDRNRRSAGGTEPGCLRFDVYHAEADPATFVLVEHWASEQAWQEHREAKAFKEIYEPQVLPRVERVPHRVKLLVE